MNPIVHFIFGRLDWSALPFWDAIEHPDTLHILSSIVATGAALVAVLGALAVLWILFRYHLWRKLWSEWLTSVDHKKIGIMYIVLALRHAAARA